MGGTFPFDAHFRILGEKSCHDAEKADYVSEGRETCNLSLASFWTSFVLGAKTGESRRDILECRGKGKWENQTGHLGFPNSCHNMYKVPTIFKVPGG